MAVPRRFRFGAAAGATGTAAEFMDDARRVEALGYDTLLVGDHFDQEWFAVGPALVAAACATTTLQVGCFVYCNNFRHPALLAREAATVDVLSEGRLEFGIGAGYPAPEYSQTGITLPAPRERVDRLQEAISVVKGLWADGPLSHHGKHYTITEMEGWPKPVQRPRPRIQIGGGGRRMLSLAAREADIVGIVPQSIEGGGFHLGRDSNIYVEEKVGWVREAAGDRFDQLELGALIWQAVVTDHRRSVADDVAQRWGMTPQQLLDSPYFLIGPAAAIVEDVQALRERHGISYLTLRPTDVDSFAPVVAHLADT